MTRNRSILASAILFFIMVLGPMGCSTVPEGGSAKPQATPAVKAAPAEKTHSATSQVAATPQKKRTRVALYIMSKCPYGVRAMNGLSGMLKKMGNSVEFSVDYIVNRRGDTFQALHGPSEVVGNIVQLCAMKIHPDQGRWLPFIDCVNRTWRQTPGNWKQCATETQLDSAAMASCIDGPEGKELLATSHLRAEAVRATGSPTILVAGKRYQGGRTAKDFIRTICRESPADSHRAAGTQACKDVPPAVAVKVTFLSDKRCKRGCDTVDLESNLRTRFFPAMVAKHLDYGNPEGKALYHKLGLKGLPAVVFGSEVQRAERYPNVQRWMKKRGDRYVLRMPIAFDPQAEICDNGHDDTGDGLVDCKDPTCTKKLVCRTNTPRTLTVFVMSQCPFAVKGFDAMKEVFSAFGKGLRFDVRYIVTAVGDRGCTQDKSYDGFCALHGPSEVKENLRQVCAKALYGRNNKYLDYLFCRNKDPRSKNWRVCATGGISARRIEGCVKSGRGAKLLRADIVETKALGIAGSPTWLVNNRHKFNGIRATAIQKNFCKYNAKTPGCEKTLSTPSAGATPGLDSACGN